VSELRWILLVAGLLVLVVIFVYSRREAGQSRKDPGGLIRRREPEGLTGSAPEDAPKPVVPEAPPAGIPGGETAAERVIAVRLMARTERGFPGEPLIVALREAGLRHGQFGIFHRYDGADEVRILFSVASLVEPGTFDLTQIKGGHYPGVSLFLILPGSGDRVAAFDDMLGTARSLAARLQGELLDEHGSRLSVQRERYLREEVIQYQHRSGTA
jgi:cell division protein ZipA